MPDPLFALGIQKSIHCGPCFKKLTMRLAQMMCCYSQRRSFNSEDQGRLHGRGGPAAGSEDLDEL